MTDGMGMRPVSWPKIPKCFSMSTNRLTSQFHEIHKTITLPSSSRRNFSILGAIWVTHFWLWIGFSYGFLSALHFWAVSRLRFLICFVFCCFVSLNRNLFPLLRHTQKHNAALHNRLVTCRRSAIVIDCLHSARKRSGYCRPIDLLLVAVERFEKWKVSHFNKLMNQNHSVCSKNMAISMLIFRSEMIQFRWLPPGDPSSNTWISVQQTKNKKT